MTLYKPPGFVGEVVWGAFFAVFTLNESAVLEVCVGNGHLPRHWVLLTRRRLIP
jgi:hypothetical protein